MVKAPKGIVCGTDASQEWLLPWWWERLRDQSDLPVLFCDFGMTAEARQWCAERGEVVEVELDPSLIVAKEAVDPELVQKWEHCYTNCVWTFRPVWFKKPFALLKTPFQKSLWLDLDCEVLQSIEPLFEFCSPKTQLGIMREFLVNHLPRFHPQAVYNSGVMVYEHGSPLIAEWAASVSTMTDRFWGDEVLLSHLINHQQIWIEELPGIFNWRVSQGVNANAVICHWVGGGGKTFIRQFGGLKPTLDKFYSFALRTSIKAD